MSNIQEGLRIYCGAKPLPPNRRRGTPLECFRRGFGVGSYLNELKLPGRVKSQLQRAEAAQRGELVKKMARDIESMGLMSFKRILRLNPLSKDLVRSIAQRENVPRYSLMSREELIDAVAQKGWSR